MTFIKKIIYANKKGELIKFSFFMMVIFSL